MPSTSRSKLAFPRLACLLFVSGAALACPALADNSPAAVEPGKIFAGLDAFKAFLAGGGDQVTGLATGELAGIGDIQAVVIQRQSPTLGPQVVLLARQADGRLRVQAVTRAADVSDVQVSVRIERGSLFIGVESTTGGAWGAYQYKRQADGRLRLIGVRLHRADNSGEPDHDTTAVVDTDFNLITGKMLFKRIGDTRPPEATAHGPACYLDDFNFAFYSCAASMKTADGTSADQLMNTP
ncbi:hypothetical protein [Pinirhizobacter soli]|uniref:hypothetical protein n=1 Tax=Pinirhizobacter soli TaxID=2786953 RepID=UPI002029EF4E|nr:hypothetical protein [Pinirhizobacter soli]